MRRDQLDHAIRTACQVIEQPEIIVMGSQAILGTYDESRLPAAATMSIEVDILPIADSNDETARLADLVEGVAGEFSPFEALHGFSIDGIDLETAVLPDGWRARLVKVQNANTAAPTGEPRFTGWCLDKEDLCVAKLVAFREKDRNFVAALLEPGLWTPTSSLHVYRRSPVITLPQPQPRWPGLPHDAEAPASLRQESRGEQARLLRTVARATRRLGHFDLPLVWKWRLRRGVKCGQGHEHRGRQRVTRLWHARADGDPEDPACTAAGVIGTASRAASPRSVLSFKDAAALRSYPAVLVAGLRRRAALTTCLISRPVQAEKRR